MCGRCPTVSRNAVNLALGCAAAFLGEAVTGCYLNFVPDFLGLSHPSI